MRFLCLFIGLALAGLTANAQSEESNKYLKAFPPAEPGMTRYVLQLPPQDNEALMKVELIVGKTVKLDTVNNYFFGGSIDQQTLDGWGFNYYLVKNIRPLAGTMIGVDASPAVGLAGGPVGLAGTMIGVDPSVAKAPRFIRLGGEPYLVRYNSRLPLVIYVPEDAQVRYRIWQADAQSTQMHAQ